MGRPLGRLVVIASIAATAAVVIAAPEVAPPSKVTVALLPLDAESRLALYGQPVADELSRALAAEGLDVAMVGQGDPVPSRAVLVVDGTIAKHGKGVALKVRVRDPARAAVLAEVSATAATLTGIDRAAATVAAKLVPKVREQLAARAAATVAEAGSGSGSAGSGSAGATAGSAALAGSAVDAAPRAPAILLVASSRALVDGRADAMVAAIAPAFEALIGATHHRAVAPVQPVGATPEALAVAVRAAGAELGIAIDVLELDVDAGAVPVGRARARIQIVDAAGARLFDRVVRTDSLVGRRDAPAAELAVAAGAQLAAVVRYRVTRATGAAP